MATPVVRAYVAMTLAMLVACSAEKPPPPAATADAPQVESPEPAAERSSVDPGAATVAVHNDPAVIHYEGFGPAKFGASEEAVRMAWGYPLESSLGAEGSSCRHRMAASLGSCSRSTPRAGS